MRPERPTFALDAFVPRFDVEQVQQLRVAAPAERAFRIASTIVPGDVPGARTLFWIRSLPARLSSQAGLVWSDGQPVLSAEAAGVTLLFERAPRERLLGLVGRFWEPSGGLEAGIASAREFLRFAEPGFAKAAISLEVEPLDAGRCRVTTRTRVLATSREARRRFGVYWALIRPGSAMLRWAFLAAVRDRAEADALGEAGSPRAAAGF